MNRRLVYNLAGLALAAGYAAQGCSTDCPNCPGPPAHLVISPQTPYVLPGDTLTLGAEVLDPSGHLLAGHPVQWRSLDDTVATIDSTGVAFGVQAGTARIVATAAGLADTAPFGVVTTSTFSKQVYPILFATCGIGGCHVTPGPPPTMNASKAALYTQLTTDTSHFVYPGDTTKGLILFRTRGDTTAVMPPQQQLSTLSPAEYHLIAVWIAQGALNN
ncbi:MAG TPA: Ig-like domain-containing protein [Gemmatimonadales bacterium]|nr:Ig-like domain-containing protein [Gemmatimonadales bacterium]